MGTNYYLEDRQPCECCGRPYERKHIGKSSAGWCFSLHVDPDDGINELDDWIALWSKPGATIWDEYGTQVEPAEMLQTITGREWQRDQSKPPLGYRSQQEFYRLNSAEPGPSGLLRHQIGRHCLAHGEGTYDLILGEFS